MTNKETAKSINQAAKAQKKTFNETKPKGETIVSIDYSLPTVSVEIYPNKEYFFQGEEAGNILEEVIAASNKFNTSVENTLIWMAISWG